MGLRCLGWFKVYISVVSNAFKEDEQDKLSAGLLIFSLFAYQAMMVCLIFTL